MYNMAMIVFSEDGNYYITLIEMHIGLLQISVIRSNLKIL